MRHGGTGLRRCKLRLPYQTWTEQLPASSIGRSSEDGAYCEFGEAVAEYIVLDSEHPSGDQTRWLESTLSRSEAEFKFLFWHRPVYPCSRYDTQYGVDAVFRGHTHVCTRTCPKREGSCVSGDSGVVYVEVGSLGATEERLSEIHVNGTRTVSGNDAAGNPRTDEYDCTRSDLSGQLSGLVP